MAIQQSITHKKIFLALLAITTGGILFVATVVNGFFYHAPEKEAVNPTASFLSTRVVTSEHIVNGKPIRLIIPAINVDADVRDVGIAYSGNVMTPDNYTDVGWYKYGPVPGEQGSAIIDGHVNNGAGFSGVFARLKELTPGDDIYVVYDDASTRHFVVTDLQSYYLDNAPKEKIFNQNDQPRLNLITCDGEWLSDRRTDDRRLVVYSVMK